MLELAAFLLLVHRALGVLAAPGLVTPALAAALLPNILLATLVVFGMLAASLACLTSDP